MLTVAYLANQFPASVEPYVGKEILELRRRGVRVIPGTVRRPDPTQLAQGGGQAALGLLCLQPFRVLGLLRALAFAARRANRIAPLLIRVLFRGKESPRLRLKALIHTWLGAYYATLLQEQQVDHIHVHHGYFGSWLAMVAARLLGISFSMTLHGSDLLVHAVYLDIKLELCRFCITVSDYNRRHILERFPVVDPGKILVARLGADLPARVESLQAFKRGTHHPFTLLAVGRLHAVKDHAFLIHACSRLRDRGLDFRCAIAGEGPERQRLESLIRENRLQSHVVLLGHQSSQQMQPLYLGADAVVLTSRSEGIPVVLMEAMVRGRIALAPAITGIPEIVIPGKTGFLYSPGMITDFVAKILLISRLMQAEEHAAVVPLDWIRHAARAHVLHNFNGARNLNLFADRFLQRIAPPRFAIENWRAPHENLVLQQI